MLSTYIQDKNDFLRFLKSRFHLYHFSNVFFRDFQYGLMAYAEGKGVRLTYGKAEQLATEIIRLLTEAGILKPIKPGSWMLVYDEFRKPSTKPEQTSKPAAAPAAAKVAPTA